MRRRQYHRLSGVVVSASFGVASTATAGYELRQLMARADAAMYVAKRDGRNRVVAAYPEPPRVLHSWQRADAVHE